MILKKGKVTKTKKVIWVEKAEDTSFGCDNCKTELNENKLEIKVFYRDKDLCQSKTSDVDKYEFCCWKCVFEFLPTIKCDYFLNLPKIFYDEKINGIDDFLKNINNGK